MNPSTRSEKFFTWLWLLIAAFLMLTVRLHHLSLPLERDEGEYAFAGSMILDGHLPYKDFYNMKFPGTYLVYAVFIALFGRSVEGLHLGVLLFCVGTAVWLWFLARKWLPIHLAALGVFCFTLMNLCLTSLSLAGHATHFVAFFAVGAVWAFITAKERKGNLLFLLSGMLAGLAMLMKQQGFFVMLAFAVVLLLARLLRKSTTRQMLSHGFLILSGFAAVMLITIGWLFVSGAGDETVFWAWKFAAVYGAMLPLSSLKNSLSTGPVQVLTGVWLIWLCALISAARIMVRKRSNETVGLMALLFLLSLVSVIPGLFLRPHYFIACFPFLSLVIACWPGIEKVPVRRWGPLATSAFLLPALITYFQLWWFTSPAVTSRDLYGNDIFAATERVSEYVRTHTPENSKILIVGSEPQIPFEADRQCATGFIYWYTHSDYHKMHDRLRAQFEIEAEYSAPATEMIIFVNYSSSLRHFNSPEGPLPWLKPFLERHHFQQNWILFPREIQSFEYDPFHLPDEPEWHEYEGNDARDVHPRGLNYISVFTRQRPEQF